MSGSSLTPSDVDFWNQRYATGDYVYGTKPNAFLTAQGHLLQKGMTALVIADGEGRNGVWLAEQGVEVLSVDISPLAQAKAQALAVKHQVHLMTQCADLNKWVWNEACFDVVVGIFIQFSGPEARQRMFNGMCAALKPGGLLLLQGYRQEQIHYATGGPKDVENLYDEALLQKAFGELEILCLYSHDSVLQEGEGHHGISALIELVARKRD